MGGDVGGYLETAASEVSFRDIGWVPQSNATYGSGRPQRTLLPREWKKCAKLLERGSE